MSRPGDADDVLLVQSRTALLDALEALDAQRDAVIIVGAQAIYLRTSGAPVALAEATKDSDLALDPRVLRQDPLIEAAMRSAGFGPNLESGQPGAWVNAKGIPVDLMVPEALAGPGGKSARSARLPPHDRRALRRVRGLEVALIDNDVMEIGALDVADQRQIAANVAGPAALVVAKLHKIGERATDFPSRLVDKDAHDIYRLLIDTETEILAERLQMLLQDEIAAAATEAALTHLRELFAAGADATGSHMAGRAEEGVGEPATVSLQVAILAADLLGAISP